jgi:CRP/FNR family transcriptional regulator
MNLNTQSTQELLQSFPLFKGLTDFEMEPILEIAKNRTYRISRVS